MEASAAVPPSRTRGLARGHVREDELGACRAAGDVLVEAFNGRREMLLSRCRHRGSLSLFISSAICVSVGTSLA